MKLRHIESLVNIQTMAADTAAMQRAEIRKKRIERLKANLARALRREKLTKTLIRKYRRKLAYYQRNGEHKNES